MLLGLAVGVIVVVRLRVLEHRSEEAEQQMRELSQQLVNTQEEERKNLSRELHDHVAQVLTGLRMELGGIERISGDTRGGHRGRRVQGAGRRHVPTVRNLALGLRPSMLDDFGLQAALEWQVRDFIAALRRSTSIWGSKAISRPAGQAPHLRLPRRPGGDDQLRPPRAGGRRSASR